VKIPHAIAGDEDATFTQLRPIHLGAERIDRAAANQHGVRTGRGRYTDAIH
jgi:hypothetical protein